MKKFILGMIAVVTLACGISSCNNAPKTSYKQGDIDTLAYAYGVMIGNQYSNFQDTGIVVPEKVMNLDNFLAGFISAMRRDSVGLEMSKEDADQFIRKFSQKLQEEMMAKRQAELNETKAKGAEYMAENAKKENVVVTESGLQIETIVEGTGKQPSEKDQVLVNYKGTFIDGTQFDANDSIPMNLNGVVKGFSEGIQSMKVGGKSIITMPSDLAYGDRDSQRIPGGSTLIFEVDLLEILPQKK